jgi:hypothetical protein
MAISKKSKKQIVQRPVHLHVWRGIAIAFIIIFALVIIGGLIRAHHFRSTFTKATVEEQQLAKDAALKDMTQRGENTTQYELRISDRTRLVKTGSTEKKIIELSFFTASVRYSYIIDVSSDEIVVSSRTEFHDNIDHSREVERNMPPPDIFVWRDHP